jgi:hypothetical protein
VKTSLKTKLLILCVSIVLIILIVAIPNTVPTRPYSAQNACINNLRQIDGAKQQWATENNKTNGPVTWNDILPYLGHGPNGGMPRCPKGGQYTLGNLDEAPKCSIGGDHSL